VIWHWSSFPVIYLVGAFMNLVILERMHSSR